MRGTVDAAKQAAPDPEGRAKRDGTVESAIRDRISELARNDLVVTKASYETNIFFVRTRRSRTGP